VTPETLADARGSYGGTAWVATLGRDRPHPAPAGTIDQIGGTSAQLGALWLWTDADEGVQTAMSDTLGVVFAGRLHNREALAATRIQDSRPEHNAEFVLRLYRRSRETALNGLRGQFALVVWDAERELLLALRDPLGYCPLYYVKREGVLLLSMSQDQLLRQRTVSKEVNRPAAAAWVLGKRFDPRQTLFADICRLPPGHRLQIDRRGGKLSRYWSPHVPERPAGLKASEAFGRFDALVSRSIDDCLCFGRAGVFLSGGIDSAAVAAFAVERSRSRGLPDPIALSLSFPYPESDESEAQIAVARALGIPHVVLDLDEAFGPEGPVRAALRAAQELPVPPLVPWTTAFDRLASEGVGQGCRVLLSGDGSEWFRAEWESSADLILGLNLFGLYALCRSERCYYGDSVTWRDVIKTLIWSYGLRPVLRDVAEASLDRMGGRGVITSLRRRRRIRSLPAWVACDEQLREELVDGIVSLVPQPIVGRRRYRGARLRFLETAGTSLDIDLYYTQSAQFGAALHDPFNDTRVIEFLLTLPPQLLWHGRHAKALAVAAIRRRLPTFDLSVVRPAFFEHPFEALVAREGRYALEDFGATPTLAELAIVEPSAIASSLETGEFGEDVRYSHVWQALALEAWLQARIG
jgi:asparagine synthase (glutamine-hydrolysing)